MKFLLDVHISKRIATALSGAGHEVVRAALEYPRWSDEDLLALANRDRSIIVSQDSDFTDLIFAFGHAPPMALIYIQCEPEDQPDFADRVLEVVENERVEGHIAVLRYNSTRLRLFPPGADND